MKRHIQADLKAEYESRKDQYSSFAAVNTAQTGKESPMIVASRQRHGTIPAMGSNRLLLSSRIHSARTAAGVACPAAIKETGRPASITNITADRP
jgi:hypothetical protein